MIDEIIKDEQIEVETETTEVDKPTEEDLAEGKSMYEKAQNKINKLGLSWTFRSIDYLVNREGITLNQLRSCVYKKENSDEIEYNIYKSCVYIIASGLINPKTITIDEYNNLVDNAKDIVEDWRFNFGNIGILQIILINIMQVKHHFFIDKKDVKVLEYMTLENLQKDIVMNTIAVDMQTKISQSQAVTL